MEDSYDILAHYGVLGMKWGVRRTPEQLGHRKAIVGAQKNRYDSRFRREAKAFAIHTVKQTLAYLVPGAALLFNAKMQHDLNKSVFDTTEYNRSQTKLSELHKKSPDASNDILRDLASVNKKDKKGYINNCLNCVTALEMRQRGYDVVASPSAFGKLDTVYTQYFSGTKLNRYKAIQKSPRESRKSWVEKNYAALCTELEANGPNARGFVSFAYEGASSGHTVMWATDSSGSVSFLDPQSGSKNATNTMSLSDQNYHWGRFDNATPTNAVTASVQNRKEDKK